MDREYIPMLCECCGAPLPSSLKCGYCTTQHERLQRYTGPTIPAAVVHTFDSFGSGSMVVNYSGSAIDSGNRVLSYSTSVGAF